MHRLLWHWRIEESAYVKNLSTITAPSYLADALMLPPIIQGGMGIGVSGWRLARAVSQLGQLGVVSGTALDLLLTRQLQMGDASGHLRRTLDAFPYPKIASRILGRYFIAGGKKDDVLFKTPLMISHEMSLATRELAIAASFVAVHLANEAHSGWVGLNLLEKNPDPDLSGALRCGACRRQRGADGHGNSPADSQNPR